MVNDFPGKWTLEHRETMAQQWYGKCQAAKWFPVIRVRPATSPLPILDGDPAAVPVLTALLKDENIRIRRLAAAALGRIGPEGKAAFPALLETANRDEDAFLRGIARVALLDIDKEAAEKAGISKYFMFWSPQPKLRATIEGHFYPAFTADAKMLVLRGEDRTIQLWDVATGNQLTFLQECTPVVWPVTFSPDGKLVASADNDNNIKLWELETGKALASLQGHTGSISSLAFSPDGKTLASGSYDNSVKLWDVASGKNISTPHKYEESFAWPECVAFSSDGKTLAAGSHDWTVKLWDVATGLEQATLEQDLYRDDAWVDSVAFSPDGRLLAWVSYDTIFLWDLADNKNFATIRGDSEHVGSVVFTPDGKMLAVGGDDYEVRLWEFPAVLDAKK
jgi:Tol biopolymer transport system component